MNSNNDTAADGAVLIVPGTDVLFTQEYHIFSVVVRKPGVNSGPGLFTSATVPDRYAIYSTMVRVSQFQPPIISIK